MNIDLFKLFHEHSKHKKIMFFLSLFLKFSFISYYLSYAYYILFSLHVKKGGCHGFYLGTKKDTKKYNHMVYVHQWGAGFRGSESEIALLWYFPYSHVNIPDRV